MTDIYHKVDHYQQEQENQSQEGEYLQHCIRLVFLIVPIEVDLPSEVIIADPLCRCQWAHIGDFYLHCLETVWAVSKVQSDFIVINLSTGQVHLNELVIGVYKLNDDLALLN